MNIAVSIWQTSCSYRKCGNSLTKEINSIANSVSLRKKARKFKKDKRVMKIESRDLGEQLMKFRDIIDALWKHAKDHMDHKDP